ncbi:MAG: hypothetical protein ABTQ34_06790 [Bdellovibrionales bacterium]
MAFFDPKVLKLNEQTAHETQDAIDRRWYLEKMWDDEAVEKAAEDENDEETAAEEKRKQLSLKEEQLEAEERLKKQEVAAALSMMAMQEPEPQQAFRELQHSNNQTSQEPMMA